MAGANTVNDDALQKFDDTAQTYFDEKIPIPRDEADKVSLSCCFIRVSLSFDSFVILRESCIVLEYRG